MLPPGFLRAFPGLRRPADSATSNSTDPTENPADQRATSDPDRFRDLFVYIVVFVALLLTGQFFIGHALIFIAAGPLGFEAERGAAIVTGWREMLSRRETLHARYATDLAHRDRTARAFAAPNPGEVVSEYFASRSRAFADLDLVLAVDERNRLLYGDQTLRDTSLEKKFLQITALKVRDLRPDDESATKDDAPPLVAATGPLYWHYYTAHGDHVYLLTLSAVCGDNGYPVQKGFVLFGYRLEGLLEGARRQLNLKSVYITKDLPAAAYASAPIRGFQSDESYYVVLEPARSLGELARRILHIILVLEGVLAAALLGYGLPYFYRGPEDTSEDWRATSGGRKTKAVRKTKATADLAETSPDRTPASKQKTTVSTKPTTAQTAAAVLASSQATRNADQTLDPDAASRDHPPAPALHLEGPEQPSNVEPPPDASFANQTENREAPDSGT
ncbi:MAG: CHASE4 domain-containing protein [Leptospirales bacterium]|jgi:hypothetical protein